ncbi:MAG TPA: heterodisulfide reductase-related iron-sulfur binding cluster [Streptosporangiaceae bacterium]
MALRIVLGLVMTAAAAVLAGRRLWWLGRLGRSGQPAPERIAAVRSHPERDVRVQATEVFGQRKLLKWTIPGLAHLVTFWGFIILIFTIIESYGDLFSRTFAIPGIGHSSALGFLEDLFAVLVLAGIVTFTIIRLADHPGREGRASRFYGSHTRAAWLVLAGIFLVVATLLLYRGAQINTGVFPYAHGAFASQLVGHWLHPLGSGVNSVLEAVFVLAQLGVILAFGVFVTYSKHLHIGIAPLNVLFSRRPNALGALEPMRSGGKVLDFEEADPDVDVFGLGKIEDFTWKGLLDLATCTECGRCQSQCPAWATGKPLSPKQVILDLRDHAFAKAPFMLAGSDEARAALPANVLAEADRPLVGGADVNGVIDPDVLWSCTNCGACVEECPVDIEHIDHIDGMRRHQVLIESAFPPEASSLLKNLENKGNPWGMGESARLAWTTELDFDVPVIDGHIADDMEYLFWVGCAGALEDRAKKTTKAIAELLHTAGVNFAVLGPAETCTGDPARRMGNEFVYSMLAQQNVETLNEAGVAKGSGKTIVASCPHCFNTIANEYPQLGGNYEVIHHTQLLARLVEQGKLTPVGEVKEKITYHDPCFLGRHNKVYTPPREIIDAVPGTRAEEMPRCKNRGFCCGAGGARMWMEERIGKRINTERIDEALALDPDSISTACPYCLVMLGDAVAAKKGSGEARESLEVIDVAQLLARSVALQRPPAPGPGAAARADAETADVETGVDAAPPGDVLSAAEGQPTTTVQTPPGDGASSPGTTSAGPDATSAAPPRQADGEGEAGTNTVEGRAPTFRPGEDGDASAVTPSEVTGSKHPGDGGREDGPADSAGSPS